MDFGLHVRLQQKARTEVFSQAASKRRPRGSKSVPRASQEPPTASQEGPKSAQKRPKRVQGTPKVRSEGGFLQDFPFLLMFFCVFLRFPVFFCVFLFFFQFFYRVFR